MTAPTLPSTLAVATALSIGNTLLGKYEAVKFRIGVPQPGMDLGTKKCNHPVNASARVRLKFPQRIVVPFRLGSAKTI